MIAPILTRGIGFGGVHYLPTLGFAIGAAPVVAPVHRIFRSLATGAGDTFRSLAGGSSDLYRPAGAAVNPEVFR
jgi:hypothetical protein